MALSWQGANLANTSSVTIPTHAIGDLIIISALAAFTTTPPSKPAAGGTVPAWTDELDNTGDALAGTLRVARFVATATNTTSGTWTNASVMAAMVIRGQSVATPIGAEAEALQANGNASNVPDITPLTNNSGSSFIIQIHCTNGFNNNPGPAAGYTDRGASALNSSSGMALSTKDVTTSDGAVARTMSAGNSNNRGAQIEILAPIDWTADSALAVTASTTDVLKLSAPLVATTSVTATLTSATTLAATAAATSPVTVTLTGVASRGQSIVALDPGVTATLTAVGTASDLAADTLAVTATVTAAALRNATVSGSLAETATATASTAWSALFSASEAVTTTFTANSLRAAFGSASLSVTATTTAVEAASDLLADTVAVTATPTADMLRAVFADTSLAETATPTAVMAWAAQFTATDPGVTAIVTADSLRAVFAGAALAVTGTVIVGEVASDLITDILTITATMTTATPLLGASANTSLAETVTSSAGVIRTASFMADLAVEAHAIADAIVTNINTVIDASLTITFDEPNNFPYTFPLLFGGGAQASIGLGQFMDAVVVPVTAGTDVDAERDVAENSTLTATATALSAMSAALAGNAGLISTATLTGTLAAAYGISANNLTVTATPTADAQTITNWSINAELIVSTDPPFPYVFPFVFQQSIDSIGLLQSATAMLAVTTHTPVMMGYGRTGDTSLAVSATPTAAVVCHYQADTALTVATDPGANISRGQRLDAALAANAGSSATGSHGAYIDTPLTVDTDPSGILNTECLVDAVLVENFAMPTLVGNRVLIDAELDAVVGMAEQITRGAIADASLLIDGNLLSFLQPESNFFPFHLA